MKIYLDTCCYGRPFDDQSQVKIRIESDAVKAAIGFCETMGYAVVGSSALIKEIGKISDGEKRRRVRNFFDASINEFALFSKEIYMRAQAVRSRANIKNLDSYHLCLAEAVGADFLLTTDAPFEKACAGLNLAVKVVNPLKFLAEVMV
jgi:hypothetical protein